jgi:hypothetical protein
MSRRIPAGTTAWWLSGLTALALAAPIAMAGGFYISIEPAPPGSKALPKDAALVLRVGGCIKPADARVSATAEGLVNGKRRTVTLQLKSISPGVYTLSRQWPAEGVWVLAITGTVEKLTCGRLVELGPNGNLTFQRRPGAARQPEVPAKSEYRKFTAEEIGTALKTLAGKQAKAS